MHGLFMVAGVCLLAVYAWYHDTCASSIYPTRAIEYALQSHALFHRCPFAIVAFHVPAHLDSGKDVCIPKCQHVYTYRLYRHVGMSTRTGGKSLQIHASLNNTSPSCLSIHGSYIMYVYIQIYRERKRDTYTYVYVSLFLSLYICIYTYII